MKKATAFLAAAVMMASLAGGALSVQAAAKTDLTIAVDADVDTLHSTDYSTTVEHDILSQIYDTLDYTFHLRNDVTFHNGTPLTAKDVKFSLELCKDSEYQGSMVTGLDSVETPDDYTVVCHLSNPYSPFMLGVCQVNIASKDYYDSSADEFATNPVGSGPYKYTGRSKGSNITLEAYDGYYRGEAPIKEVNFEVIPDQSTTAIALQTGEVNFATIESSTIAQLSANPNIEIAEVANSGFTYVSMNTEKEPFNNVKVRQAINYAINRENLVQVCYDGEAEVNSNICSKDRFGYSDDQFQYTYDPEKAKELLAEAGIETPYDLGEMLVAEKYSNIATVLQSDLAAVGLNVTIAVKEFNSYIGDLTSGNYGITALEMTLDGDTQMLEMAFTSDYIGTANNARYSDATMDELFEKTRTETDTDARKELFDEILTKAQDEAIYAVIDNPLTLFAYNTDLNCPEFPYEGIYSIYDFTWAE